MRYRYLASHFIGRALAALATAAVATILAAGPAQAEGPGRTVLQESTGEQLQLELRYDPATLERISGVFQWGKARCYGTVRQAGISREGELILQQTLQGGRCVRGCQVMLQADLQQWREVCNGRETARGSFDAAEEGAALRDFVLAQVQEQGVRREQAERAAFQARQLPEPDTTADLQPAAVRKQLRVQVLHADDFGFAALRDPSGNWQLLAAGEWHQGSPGASAAVAVTPKLKVGRNVLVLGIHNKAFAFGPGRWSYAFALQGESGLVWQGQGGAAGGAVGIRWWKAVQVDKDKAGNLRVSLPEAALLGSVRLAMADMHEFFIKEHGTETSMMQAVLGTVANSMFGGGASRSGGRSSQDEADDANDRYRAEAERRYQQEAAARQAAADAQSARLREPNSLGW